jgi:hypothetical protein
MIASRHKPVAWVVFRPVRYDDVDEFSWRAFVYRDLTMPFPGPQIAVLGLPSHHRIECFVPPQFNLVCLWYGLCPLLVRLNEILLVYVVDALLVPHEDLAVRKPNPSAHSLPSLGIRIASAYIRDY